MPKNRIVVWPEDQTEVEPEGAPWQQGGGGMSWVPYEVLESGMSAAATLCFAWLTNYPRERQWLRIGDLIEMCGCTEDEVRQGMAELSGLGFIEQVDTGEDEPSWRVA